MVEYIHCVSANGHKKNIAILFTELETSALNGSSFFMVFSKWSRIEKWVIPGGCSAMVTKHGIFSNIFVEYGESVYSDGILTSDKLTIYLFYYKLTTYTTIMLWDFSSVLVNILLAETIIIYGTIYNLHATIFCKSDFIWLFSTFKLIFNSMKLTSVNEWLMNRTCH